MALFKKIQRFKFFRGNFLNNMVNKMLWLGTGGGRICSYLQARATGGLILNLQGYQIHIDPGPGAIVRTRQYKISPEKTDIVILTHCHTDHVNDALIILEAMSSGNVKKKGTVISNKTCMFGYEDFDPVVHRYIKKNLKNVYVLEPKGKIEFESNLKITATKTEHDDPLAIGIKFEFNNKKISVVGDTSYFKGLAKEHEGAQILILNVLRPSNLRWKGHMCTEDAIALVKEINPAVVIIQHFGMKMLSASPTLEARRIHTETGVDCISAKDGMSFDVEELLSLAGQKKLTNF